MTDSPILSLQRQYELLQMEYEYEKEQFRQQTELMGIAGRSNGACAGIRFIWDGVIIVP